MTHLLLLYRGFPDPAFLAARSDIVPVATKMIGKIIVDFTSGRHVDDSVVRVLCGRKMIALRSVSLGQKVSVIWEVVDEHSGFVMMKTRVGATRVVDMLSGEQLPRIC